MGESGNKLVRDCVCISAFKSGNLVTNSFVMVYDGDSVASDKQLLQLTKSSNISGQTVTATSGKVRVPTNSPLFDNF